MPVDIKKLVDNPHPINRQYSSYWDFLLQSYEGGVDYSNSALVNQPKNGGLMDSLFRLFINGRQQNLDQITGNLFQHPKERTEDYNRRVFMSYYYNFCAPIIDIYADHLFKQAIIEDYKSLDATIKVVRDDIDQQGSSIEEFRKNVSNMAQMYGHCFVLVDSPKVQEVGEVYTQADQIEKRAYPYLCLIPPQRVKNWALDKFGLPYWVLIEEVADGNSDPAAFSEDARLTCQYRLWTREEWFLYNGKYELIDQGVHDVGEVPITCVVDKKSNKAKNFLGISSIADIAFIARDIYNASSELRQILRDQTFAFLALQGTSDEYSDIDLGTGKGLLYPEARNAPQYVSPPADNALTYFDHIDRQITKIYQLAKLEAGVSGQAKSAPSGGGTVDNQSGVSKAWSFNQTNSSLSSKSSNMEDAEKKWWSHYAAWMGLEFDGNVQYPNEFSITSLVDDLNEAEQESRLGLGKTFNIEIRKAIQKKKFPRKSDEELEKMAKEVEELQSQTPGSAIANRVKQLLSGQGENNNTGNPGEKGGNNGTY